MSSARIVEAVYVFEDGEFCSSARWPSLSPNQFSFDRLKEGFHDSIVVAVTFARHGSLKLVLAQDLLRVMRTILAASLTMMEVVTGAIQPQRITQLHLPQRLLPLTQIQWHKARQ